ncbi:hypothetical protein A5886_001835 [Enterococcus sp. 8G7_MSG3316]|uniref:Uncharacterized protein n=1 Tax=Candidatus Enterococcus testudinis TaxID=1834191 RepID=A0A242A6T8_9ENTE|nr:hypothetical protein [Enterococcus sp. 8G7_MSG3316]OTN76756.1 hypothetical protein A5886_001835 [Enterococcus sp. 8G7_MSG3316]
MNGILVYAKTKNERQFIGVFRDLDDLQSEVEETLAVTNRSDLASSVYFILNGEEYKLFLEVEQ